MVLYYVFCLFSLNECLFRNPLFFHGLLFLCFGVPNCMFGVFLFCYSPCVDLWFCFWFCYFVSVSAFVSCVIVMRLADWFLISLFCH